MTSTIAADLITRFRRLFGAEPRLFRAPGRVNLIGEHTDYNDGFVMPAALDLATYTAIALRPDHRLRVHSLAFATTVEFDLDELRREPRRDWSDYVGGVAIMLERAGHRLNGADLMIDGDLPMGSGLSASAALEVSVGYALADMSNVDVDLIELAKCCQQAENEFVGMRCGIMDQFISCRGIEGNALLLDCRSLAARPVRIDPRARLVICNTMVHHELASSEYNLRRQDCERAVALLSSRLGGIRALRDVTPERLAEHAALLPETVFRRARHVISENDRVLKAAAALEAGNLILCGRMMNESHASLRDDYEVSCRELDLMVELASGVEGVYGSRMTGGGFGGCTVTLIEAGAADCFAAIIGKAYRSATGLTTSVFCCSPGPGAGPVVPRECA
jgi:galactokinase